MCSHFRFGRICHCKSGQRLHLQCALAVCDLHSIRIRGLLEELYPDLRCRRQDVVIGSLEIHLNLIAAIQDHLVGSIIHHIYGVNGVAVVIPEKYGRCLGSGIVSCYHGVHKQLLLRHSCRLRMSRTGIRDIAHAVNIIVIYHIFGADIIQVHTIVIAPSVVPLSLCLSGLGIVGQVRQTIPYHNIIFAVSILIQLHVRLQPLIMCCRHCQSLLFFCSDLIRIISDLSLIYLRNDHIRTGTVSEFLVISQHRDLPLRVRRLIHTLIKQRIANRKIETRIRRSLPQDRIDPILHIPDCRIFGRALDISDRLITAPVRSRLPCRIVIVLRVQNIVISIITLSLGIG